MSFKTFLALTFIIHFSLFLPFRKKTLAPFRRSNLDAYCIIVFFSPFFEPNKSSSGRVASPSGPSLLLSAGFEMSVFSLYQTAFSLGKFIFILKCISVWFLVSSSLARAREQRVNGFCFRVLLRFSLRSRTRPSVNTPPILENEACSVYPVSFPRNSSDLRAVGLVTSFPCS